MGKPNAIRLVRSNTASLDSRTRFLEKVSLFSSIREIPDAMAAFADAMEERAFPAGSVIVEEGKQGTETYFLLEGRVDVFKSTAEGEKFPVAVLDARDYGFFGEGSLLENESRSASIVAATACRCLVLDRPVFESLGESHPEWAFPVLASVARSILERLRKANNELVLLYKALIREISGNLD